MMMTGPGFVEAIIKKEEYSYSCGVCDEAGGVDEEFPQAVAENRGEYDSGADAG